MDFNWMKSQEKNSYSDALRIFGWIYIFLGLIGALVLGNTFKTYYGEFNLPIFLGVIFGVGLFGVLILGLAEIVRLLNDNRRLLAVIASGDLKTNANNSNDTVDDELPEL